jgi:hypothetical protein
MTAKVQKVFRRSKSLHSEAGGFEEPPERLADRIVIVHDRHQGECNPGYSLPIWGRTGYGIDIHWPPLSPELVSVECRGCGHLFVSPFEVCRATNVLFLVGPVYWTLVVQS